MAPFKIEWEAPEFSYRQKNLSWYWLSIIASVVIIGFSIWQKNFLFGFFVVIAEVLVLTWSSRQPREIAFELSDRGLEIDKLTLHAYADFENFSIETDFDPDWPDIYLVFKSKIKPTLRIKAPKDRLAEIQKAFSSALPQAKHERTLMEAVERIIGF